MSQMIQERLRTRSTTGPARSRPTAPRRRGIPSVVIAAGALAVAVALTLGVRAMTGSPATKAPAPFADGTTVEVVLRCTGSSCIAGTTDRRRGPVELDHHQRRVDPRHVAHHDVTGTVKVDSEWGDATFTSGGRSIVVVGGMATPEHSFFG